ncbi:unnamed protein product [[Candida] boidinii]|uniref:Unnamed protein product n=1 Tax=Candida boidinii TaxID=5477 RepID=A0ACB5U346_CANBO|nr:unnamed protein product [[Candida] boidinii]
MAITSATTVNSGGANSDGSKNSNSSTTTTSGNGLSTPSSGTVPTVTGSAGANTASQDSNILMHNKKTAPQESSADEEEQEQRIRIKENNKQLWTALDLSGQLISNLTDKVFNYQFLRRLYLNGNKFNKLPNSISKLKCLRVLDVSSNNLTEIPKEIGMLFNLKYLYLFDNDIKNIPNEFGNLYDLKFLGIEGNLNMDKEIIELISKKGTRGLVIHLRDNCLKLDNPKQRLWIKISDEDGEPVIDDEIESRKDISKLSSIEDSSFTLMSYNTLCHHYATPKMYKYTPSWALNWNYRKEKLTEEILSYKTNIICLQEVETRTYEEYWVPLMEKLNYKGIFHCKGRARTMNEKNAKKVDGCATFYRTNIFELVEKKFLDYSGLVMTQEKFKKTEDVFNRFLNKDNVASVF